MPTGKRAGIEGPAASLSFYSAKPILSGERNAVPGLRERDQGVAGDLPQMWIPAVGHRKAGGERWPRARRKLDGMVHQLREQHSRGDEGLHPVRPAGGRDRRVPRVPLPHHRHRPLLSRLRPGAPSRKDHQVPGEAGGGAHPGGRSRPVLPLGIGHLFAGSLKKDLALLVLGLLMAISAPVSVLWLYQAVDAFWETGGV